MQAEEELPLKEAKNFRGHLILPLLTLQMEAQRGESLAQVHTAG